VARKTAQKTSQGKSKPAETGNSETFNLAIDQNEGTSVYRCVQKIDSTRMVQKKFK